ncbi:MAG: hypothetical protein ABS44_13705 [Chryseobacterium sp. SCN 40-13]|nr:MAG: hypothetical protein ABS44_13705 [Chryseobacterium sp. SCN 40-13]
MKYNGVPTACEAFSYGEVEDYTVNLQTGGTTPVTYCTSKGNSVSDEYIGRVQLGTINNASTGGTGYTDFTSISTNLVKSSSNTITVTPTWTGTAYSEGYAVWIDYNQDGDFADSGELVWSKTASTATPATGSFTVPATALSGATRMRVSMKYNAVPTACEAFSYGEVEDYTVNIVNAAKEDGFGRGNTIADIQLYPNPTSDILNITAVSEKATFRIFNLLGQEVIKGSINNNIVNVNTITSGNYILEINDNDTVVSKRFIKR